jgi:chorismate mutase / prephenate dehydratase
MDKTMMDQEIRERRRQIDALDDELLHLLNRRAELASRVLKIKRNAGMAVHDAQREADIVMRMRTSNRGPLNEAAVENIFRCIVTEVRKAEEAEDRLESRSK